MNVAAALELLDVSFPGDLSRRTTARAPPSSWTGSGSPTPARHLALEVFARSFFAHPDSFSAGELVAMFHCYFLGSSEGLLFDVPCDDYDTALWAPLGRYLAAQGVESGCGRRGRPAEFRQPAARTGRCGSSLSSGDDLTSTVPCWRPTRRPLAGWSLKPTWTGLTSWTLPTGGAGWLRSVRPRLSRSGGCGSIGRCATTGRRSSAPVATARSTTSRCWNGSRRVPGAGRCRHGGSVVELHAYALGDGERDADLRARLRQELGRVYPETVGAQVVADEWLVRDDCPLVGTGPWRLRPEVGTPHPRLMLAGDGIRCDYPVALMERAATTGFLAANRLLAEFGPRRPRPVDRPDARSPPGRTAGSPAAGAARSARELAAAPELVAAFGVGQVVHPQLPCRPADARLQDRRHPAGPPGSPGRSE